MARLASFSTTKSFFFRIFQNNLIRNTVFEFVITFTKNGIENPSTTLLSIVQAMLIHGMIVQGRADDKHYGVTVTGAPKKKDLAECEKLGQRVAALVLKLNPA